MSVKIFKNFLTNAECGYLNSVAKESFCNGLLENGVDILGKEYTLRKTNRISMRNKAFPNEVKNISEKVRKFVGIDQYPIVHDHGSEGIMVTYTLQHGTTFRHVDPKANNSVVVYRCNVLTQKNEDGGDLYVNGEKVDIDVGDLHCYAVSEIPHEVTQLNGVTPRIMWIFGAYIPKEQFVIGEY